MIGGTQPSGDDARLYSDKQFTATGETTNAFEFPEWKTVDVWKTGETDNDCVKKKKRSTRTYIILSLTRGTSLKRDVFSQVVSASQPVRVRWYPSPSAITENNEIMSFFSGGG